MDYEMPLAAPWPTSVRLPDGRSIQHWNVCFLTRHRGEAMVMAEELRDVAVRMLNETYEAQGFSDLAPAAALLDGFEIQIVLRDEDALRVSMTLVDGPGNLATALAVHTLMALEACEGVFDTLQGVSRQHWALYIGETSSL